ncbi:meiosis initiator protein [Erinaceus europaeus]|uniref:Meiosis initiator protein n=1 Tax=Erinaceus europaeus TaxID=9365 RepID=A0ABM3VVG6_ERIEU|nr:meiosis initiator protein [Erinaceus europaeus]
MGVALWPRRALIGRCFDALRAKALSAGCRSPRPGLEGRGLAAGAPPSAHPTSGFKPQPRSTELRGLTPGADKACAATQPLPGPEPMTDGGGTRLPSMWGSSRLLDSNEQPRTSFLNLDDRKQRKNHTNKLQELAMMLPITAKMGAKKATKKEILLHILHYIQFLQRSIDVARSLISIYTTEVGGVLGGLGQNLVGGPVSWRHSTPSSSPHSLKPHLQGTFQKPRKKKTSLASEHQSRAQNSRRCLSLDKLKRQGSPGPDLQGAKLVETNNPPRNPDSSTLKIESLPPPQGEVKEEELWLTMMDMPKTPCENSSCICRNSEQPDGLYCASQALQGPENIHFLKRKQHCPRQKLAFESGEEVDNSLDADPWLPVWTPEGSPHGSALALGPPQINHWDMTGHPSEILGLSPSLFSSPGKLLPEQILEDSNECLTQAFFEEVFLDPVASPLTCMLEVPKQEPPSEVTEDLPDAYSLQQSSVSLDHCYLPLSDSSKVAGSPSSQDTDSTDSSQDTGQQEIAGVPEGLLSSSEDGDYTWTPTLRPTGRKAKKGRRADKGPTKPKENQKGPCTTQPKKKCVNGFIMFCRMNRKQYIRACPGTASTAATKELAQLWRVMTQQERRPYCIKARRFSRQHNRNVKQESASSEDEEWGHPKPFYQLLAEKARRSAEEKVRCSAEEKARSTEEKARCSQAQTPGPPGLALWLPTPVHRPPHHLTALHGLEPGAGGEEVAFPGRIPAAGAGEN